MNIAIASATRRFKEIGVRKVVGSNRSQLIKQFLCENVLVCFLAFVLGVLLAELIITPGFNNLWWGIFDLDLDYAGSINLWLFFAALLLLTGIGSGAWPAFFISSFQPVNIFKGSLKIGGKNRFTKILLGFQFILSFLIITNSVVFIQNSRYMRQQDWGYNQEHLLVLPVETGSQYKLLEDEIDRNPGVLRTAGAVDHIGRTNTNVVVKIIDKELEVVQFRIGFDYFETMGLRLKSGRIFDEDRDTDRQESIMINETFENTLGWQDAIGKVVIQNDRRYKVIGVFEDFRTPDHFMSRIEPMMLRVMPEQDLTCLIAKISAGNGVRTAGFTREVWQRVIPERPYTGYFQDEIFNEIFQAMDGITTTSLFVGTIALVMTCMGIFGLVSLNIAKRTRELSIRKVLGANVPQVIRLINRSFVNVLLIATVIAMPVNYFASQAFLALFTDHIPLGWLPFAIAFGLVLLTAVATICTGVYKAAVANPVEALRT
jgi:cell division protein FtsX